MRQMNGTAFDSGSVLLPSKAQTSLDGGFRVGFESLGFAGHRVKPREPSWPFVRGAVSAGNFSLSLPRTLWLGTWWTGRTVSVTCPYRINMPPIPVVVPFGYLHVPVHVPSGPLLQVEFVPSEVTVQVPVPPSQ